MMHQGVKVGWSVCESVSGCVSEQLERGICVCVSVNEGVCVCVCVCAGCGLCEAFSPCTLVCICSGCLCPCVHMSSSWGRFVFLCIWVCDCRSLHPALASELPIHRGFQSSWHSVEGTSPLPRPCPSGPHCGLGLVTGPSPFLLPQLKWQPHDWRSLSGQIIANHHMQSISFASGGDTVRPQTAGGGLPAPLSPKAPRCPARAHQSHPHVAGTSVSDALSLQDMADYVAYVAKDPINQRGEASGGGWGRGLDPQPVETPLMLPDDPQPVTSWSAARALPRVSSAPWAKPLSCASNSTCTAPPGSSSPRKGTGLTLYPHSPVPMLALSLPFPGVGSLPPPCSVPPTSMAHCSTMRILG